MAQLEPKTVVVSLATLTAQLNDLNVLIESTAVRLPESLKSKFAERVQELLHLGVTYRDLRLAAAVAGDEGIRLEAGERVLGLSAAIRTLNRDLDLVFKRHVNLLGGASAETVAETILPV